MTDSDTNPGIVSAAVHDTEKTGVSKTTENDTTKTFGPLVADDGTAQNTSAALPIPSAISTEGNSPVVVNGQLTQEIERRERIENEIREKQIAIDARLHRSEDVERKLNEAKNSLGSASAMISRLMAELDLLGAIRKKSAAVPKGANEELRQKELEISARSEQIAIAEKEIADREREIDARRAKIARLSEERRSQTHKRENEHRDHDANASGAKRDAAHLHEKTLDISRLENEGRLLAGRIANKERDRDRLRSGGRDTHLADGEIRRLQGLQNQNKTMLDRSRAEVRTTEIRIKEEEATALDASRAMHKKDNELNRLSDESMKLNREIGLATNEIETKRALLRELRTAVRESERDRESARRAFELGHFTVQAELNEFEKKKQELARYDEEVRRRTLEVASLSEEKRRIDKEIFEQKQDFGALQHTVEAASKPPTTSRGLNGI